MNEPYELNHPKEVLIDQMEDSIDHAAAVNVAFTPRKIFNTGYNLVFDTGVFIDEYKAWSKLEEANQTWENFCRMFAQSRIDLQERSGTARSVVHYKNAQQDTEDLETIRN